MKAFEREGNPDRVLSAGCAMLEQGKSIAIATVIQTWGSSPRPVGSQLVVSEDDDLVGSVSGGCVEAAVLVEAQASICTGECKILEYGVAQGDAFAANLSCGGKIRILVEPVETDRCLPVAMLHQMSKFEDHGTPYVYEVDINNWSRTLHTNNDDLPNKIKMMLDMGESALEGVRFWNVRSRPRRLFVVGAVHIAQFLCPMAQMLGYDVFVLDNRELFLNEARFKNVTLLNGSPDHSLRQQGLDARSALVTLTHDHKFDLPALEVALASDCFYVGALGSRQTHRDRIDALKAKGYGAEPISRIHGPVGLKIGAKSPAEIATAITAEMVAIAHHNIEKSRML